MLTIKANYQEWKKAFLDIIFRFYFSLGPNLQNSFSAI